MRAEELVLNLGYSATMELIERWGGSRLYVPQNIGPEHPLMLRLGPYACGQLSALYGGVEMDLPPMTQVMKNKRLEEIFRRYESGTPIPKLAQEFGYSQRWTRILLNRRKREKQNTEA